MSRDDLHKMKGLDLYLSSLNEDDYNAVAKKLRPLPARLPLISWDLYSQAYKKQISNLEKNNDRAALNTLKEKHLWNVDFDSIDWKNLHYEAVVVTDADIKIIHASPGFVSMTGYAVKEALGKSPKFLQGKNTSAQTRENIKQALANGEPITASLMNYRKNGEEYLCEVNILPLYNNKNRITHFIAFEREAA